MYYLRKKNQQMIIELESANRELMTLDGLKSEIIKVISQEIRNPLNRIMGTLHMLKDKIEGEELSDVVNLLDSSVSKLEEFSSMTEQIFVLKSPGHELKLAKVPLRQIIEYSLIDASEEMKGKGIGFDLQNEISDAILLGESHLLVKCLVNLLRNAISHCDSNGKIIIKTREEDENIICEVIDQGKEYSEQLSKDLTIQFSSSENSLNLNFGIELALAQMIMEAHQGKILFNRSTEGSGSVKMIFYPREKKKEQASQAT